MRQSGSVLVALAFVWGCGGGDDAKDPEGEPSATHDGCSVTFSGALSETKDCVMFINQIESNTDPNPYIGGGTLDGLFGFNVYDVPTTTGRYATGGSDVAMGILNDRTPSAGNLPQQWRMADNFPGTSNTGSYEFEITAISSNTSTSTVKQWPIDGTLDATYTPVDSSGATGTITIHMEF